MSYTKESIQHSVKERLQQIRSFLKAMNQCPLCTEPLSLIHEIDKDNNEIQETAHCSKCNLDVRKKQHQRH